MAFIRSLGSRGVSMVGYGPTRAVAGKWSRHLDRWEHSPSVHDGAEYLPWLTEQLRSGRITHVAPTSDYTVYATAIAMQRAGIDPPAGAIPLDRAWACLHKPTFDDVAERVDFAPVPGALPTSLDEAVEAANGLGYPVVIKPRTHIGVGLHRGSIARDDASLRSIFEPLVVDDAHHEALDLDPDLAWPMMQRLVRSDDLEVVSISGCLTPDGPRDVGCTSKTAQWPPGLGVGSMFESRPAEPDTERAIALVTEALGQGLFEIELVVDRTTGEAWPIDLNPRAYGQVALEVARGHDLPGAWYALATGIELPALPVRDPVPERWVNALAYHPGAFAGVVRGPQRRTRLRQLVDHARTPRVGSIFDRRDPFPAIFLSAAMLRHPGGLIRPFLRG